MSDQKVSRIVRHNWQRRKGTDIHDCPACGSWTANLPLYRDEVCSQKDRRNKDVAGRRFGDV